MFTRVIAAFFVLFFGVASSTAAFAQSNSFSLQLNKAVPWEKGCRLTYVAVNRTGEELLKTTYEIAIFSSDGEFLQILQMDFGDFSNGKTRVLQFDLADPPCEDISRLLINGVVECTNQNGPTDVCMKQLDATSRLKIVLDL